MPTSPGDAKLPVNAEYLVVLCHGIDGDPSNLGAIKRAFSSMLDPNAMVHVWDSAANCGGRMKDGVGVCAERLWSELQPLLKEKLVAHSRIIRVSFAGHSLGGLILRALATRLFVWCTEHGVADRFAFDSYISIAVPHLGVRTIGEGVSGEGPLVSLIRAMPPAVLRAASRVFTGAVGSELLLEVPTLLNVLSDETGCLVLRHFACRMALSNVSGDWTVPYQSACLLDAEEAALVRGAWRGKNNGVLWSNEQARDVEQQLLPTMRMVVDTARTDGVRTLVVTRFPDTWDPTPTAAQHATNSNWREAQLAAQTPEILRRLRGCGDWEVHAVEFGERATTLMGMRLPHVDIAAIPEQRNSDAGLEVARLVVQRVIQQMACEPTPLAR